MKYFLSVSNIIDIILFDVYSLYCDIIMFIFIKKKKEIED